jgi:hypothetical protein
MAEGNEGPHCRREARRWRSTADTLAATEARQSESKRLDRRFAQNQNGKRRVRQRGGNSVPAVFQSENQASAFIRARYRLLADRRRNGHRNNPRPTHLYVPEYLELDPESPIPRLLKPPQFR